MNAVAPRWLGIAPRIWLAALTLAAIAVAGCSRRDRLADLPYFPGAAYVGATSFVAEQFGFPPAAWEQVELRSTVPYEQVRAFYAKTEISGQTATFESELRKSGGRVYSRFMADRQRRRFYAITVEERSAARDTSVLLRYGVAR